MGVSNVDPDVCETAALAHDLGHPPFGHNGELTLDRLGTDAGLTDGYEGNAQSLRILLSLAHRAEFPGLNLTAASLRATIKYPWGRHENVAKPHKYGVYAEERTDFERIWQGLEPQKQTLEASIMDWADDIAYSVHDFFDFRMAGVIPETIQLDPEPFLRGILGESNPGGFTPESKELALQFLCEKFSLLPTVDPRTSRFSSPALGHFREWVSSLIRRYSTEMLGFDRAPEGQSWHLSVDEVTRCEVEILKKLTYTFAIDSPALAMRQHGEQATLRSLFQILLEDALLGSPRLLSTEARTRIDFGASPIRVVLDTISSMTDAQAVAVHNKLLGRAPVSILDVSSVSVF
jgi:dGTPase